MIKTIFIYWNSSFENAPEVCKRCLETWKYHNPDWNIIELNDKNIIEYIDIKEYIPDIDKKNIAKTALSDIIRIFLLKKYGGIWCDSTVFCMKPLNNWLNEYIKEGFFAFNNPGGERMLSSWFLYSEKNNYITQKWFEYTVNYWNNNNHVSGYYWFHDLFKNIYINDDEFKNQWNNVPKISADIPHYILNNNMLNNLTENIKNHIDNKKSPMYKITYKYDINHYKENSSLFYLLNHNKNQNNIKNNYTFIHIGKCGGTSVLHLFKLKEIHLTKPIFQNNNKYIIWIRNPLTRFVSAFNMSYHLINLDTSNLNIHNLSLDNCLAPGRVQSKMQNNNKITFDPEYDQLINYFQTPNNLAESLTSNDIEKKKKAIKLMTYDKEHIFKGIGWYLSNGDFIKNHFENILMVGKLENMKEDLNKLSSHLNIDISNKKDHYRENKTKNTYLSDLAIQNLLDFYKDTDYKTLEILYEFKFIDKLTLDSYYKYGG